MNTWYLPITILPGIGLLIISTSTLIVSLNEELERLLTEANINERLIHQKLSQMKLLTYSMTGFYISIALMVLSGLVSFSSVSLGIGSAILISGVFFIFLSLIILVVYSVRAVKIRHLHFDECLKKID
ncbi:MAG: hypothetical protein RI575_11980 [Balneolaceae bacterium]|nr:hypothetical protein [Balneolaceae bacterium]